MHRTNRLLRSPRTRTHRLGSGIAIACALLSACTRGQPNENTGNTISPNADRLAIVDVALYGSDGEDTAYSVTSTANGPLIVGSFVNQAELPGRSIRAVGSADGFVATPDTPWTTTVSGTDTEYVSHVTATDDGGAIVAGFFYDETRFGDITLTARGWRDAFIGRIDANGTWQWAQAAGGASDDEAVGVTISDDHVVVTGNFRDRATFGDSELVSAGNWDIFVARLTLDGDWENAVSGGGPDADFARSITTDDDGGVLITGEHAGTITFGEHTLTPTGSNDLYVAKLDHDNTWTWAVGTGPSGEAARAIHGDGDGGAIVTGTFYGVTFFGSQPLVAAGNWDGFIARLDRNGIWQWAQAFGGTGDDTANAVTVSKRGIVVSGTFTQTASFGERDLTALGARDAFAAVLDLDGNWLDAIAIGGPGDDVANAVTVTSDNRIVIVGSSDGDLHGQRGRGESDIFVARLS